MEFPKGIEGDYIETKEENLIFDVKGLLHPNDRKICFIRFYLDPKGDRIREGQKYKKIYDLKERYSFLSRNYPKYIFFSEQLGFELQGVKSEDIKKIYTPRECFENLREKNILSRLEKYSLELCDLFINEGNLPRDSIGITGSPMVGLSMEESDIDLVIYGTEASLEFQDKLVKIFKNSNYCREYNLHEYQTHYEWRVGGSNIPFNKFLDYEKRKLHQGMYKGFEFFIRYIKSPNDWGGSFYDYKYENRGRIKIKAEILDSTDSIFTPCSYKINVLDIIKNSENTPEINENEILEVNSFRGRFCEQAIKGEKVIVEGKIEKVTFQNKKEYFQLVLVNQSKDKMLLV